MATANKNLSKHDKNSIPNGKEFKLGIAASEWNQKICDDLLSGALETLKSNGVLEENVQVVRIPGAFELPFAASLLLKTSNLDGVLCLGCVIKGETRHDQYINQSVATGITQLGLMSGKPIIYGVITAEDQAQAEDRAGGKHGNKGVEGAVTLLRMISLKKNLTSPQGKNIGF